MGNLTSFDFYFYGGMAVMALAGLLFVAQAIFFIANRQRINKKLDEEYGQPQQYNRKGERG